MFRDSKNTREEERNRRNRRSGGTVSKPSSRLKKPVKSKPRRISGDEFFTFSLDGLLPPYGDPSQVGSSKLPLQKIFLFYSILLHPFILSFFCVYVAFELLLLNLFYSFAVTWGKYRTFNIVKLKG